MLELIYNWFSKGSHNESTNFMSINQYIGLTFFAAMLVYLFMNLEKLRADKKFDNNFRRFVGFYAIFTLILLRVHELIINQGNIWRAMPFHYCSVGYMFVIWSMFSNNKRIWTFTFLMGVTGASLGLFFPGIYIDIIYYRAIEYYLSHSLLLLIPFYLVLVHDLKIDNKRYVIDFSLLMVFFLITISFYNDFAGTDYFFLNGGMPEFLLKVLPPWPQYAFVIILYPWGAAWITYYFATRFEKQDKKRSRK